MSENQQKIKRSTYIVDKTFQYKYTFYILFLGLLIYASMGYLLYVKSVENTNLTFLDGAEKSFRELKNADEKTQITEMDPLFAIVEQGDEMAKRVMIISGLAFLALLAILSITITHRIVGPIFYISTLIGQIRDGNIPDPRPLRKRDEFKGFFTDFAQMLEELKEKNRSECEIIEGAINAIDDSQKNKAELEKLQRLLTEKKQNT